MMWSFAVISELIDNLDHNFRENNVP